MSPKSSPKPSSSANASTAQVQQLLDALKHQLKDVILGVRAIIRASDNRIVETIKWNAPSYSLSEHFATFHLRANDAVQLVLHLGTKPRPDVALRTQIVDPNSLLQWRAADRALATFRSLGDVQVHEQDFVRILQQWITFL